MNTSPITVDATVDADVQKVWNYWNTPERITQWNFANKEWHCSEAKIDLKVGGKMYTRMEARNGSFGFDFEGTFEEIMDLKKITYVMPDGRKVSTTFENDNGNTKVSTTFDAENQSPVGLQKAGWQAILDNFKRYVEAN